jgi:hypothetical protein
MIKLTPGSRAILQEKLPLAKVAAVPSQVIAETPESASETVPATVTAGSVKLAPSAGEETVKAGALLSILRVTAAVAVFPAASVTVPLTTWPTPSEETTCAAGQDATAALPAAQVKVTITLLLFQPPALGAGETPALMDGGVAAAVTFKFAIAAPMPAPNVAVMVAVPLPTAVIRPLVPAVATAVLEEAQVATAVRSRVLPSAKVPVAVYC